MASTPNPPKFVHQGKIVDIPLSIRIKHFFQDLYQFIILWIWTLFSIDARQAAITYQQTNKQPPTGYTLNGGNSKK